MEKDSENNRKKSTEKLSTHRKFNGSPRLIELASFPSCCFLLYITLEDQYQFIFSAGRFGPRPRKSCPNSGWPTLRNKFLGERIEAENWLRFFLSRRATIWYFTGKGAQALCHHILFSDFSSLLLFFC